MRWCNKVATRLNLHGFQRCCNKRREGREWCVPFNRWTKWTFYESMNWQSSFLFDVDGIDCIWRKYFVQRSILTVDCRSIIVLSRWYIYIFIYFFFFSFWWFMFNFWRKINALTDVDEIKFDKNIPDKLISGNLVAVLFFFFLTILWKLKRKLMLRLNIKKTAAIFQSLNF